MCDSCLVTQHRLSGVQFVVARLHSVLAVAAAGGWTACFNAISSASVQSLTGDREILSLLSDICFACTERQILES